MCNTFLKASQALYLEMKSLHRDVLLFFFVLCFYPLSALIEPIELPIELQKCNYFQNLQNTALNVPQLNILSDCLNELETKNHDDQSMTKDARKYIDSLLRKVKGQEYEMNKRTKRQSDIRTTTGTRKEVRMLKKEEWNRLVSQLNRLKNDKSVRPNRYDVIASIHSGVTIGKAHGGPAFLPWHRIYLLILEAALGMTIPYWDSSIDFYMSYPERSPLFTPSRLGNGNGSVINGPFASWGITRDIANGGSLISQQMIGRVLSRTRHSEITEGTSQSNPLYSLEGVHNAVHVWVGGDMLQTNRAAYDPIFFMHHAFIDYIWHLFLQQQFKVGRDPVSDYPRTSRKGHRSTDRMASFPKFQNRDGHRPIYENRTLWMDDSKLQCSSGICAVPMKVRLSSAVASKEPASAMAKDTLVSFNAAKLSTNMEIGGGQFVSHFTDTRTKEGNIHNLIPVSAKMKRSVVYSKEKKSSSQEKYVLDDTSNINNPNETASVYIKVKVVFSPYASKTRMPQKVNYKHCIKNNNRLRKIWVQSIGINYPGKFKTCLLFGNDTGPVKDILIPVKKPIEAAAATETFVSVYDTCGQVCVPDCSTLGHLNCTGALKITPDHPLMYQTDKHSRGVDVAMTFICYISANQYK